MLAATADLLNRARLGRYSVGAFNVYTLEQAHGVVNAAAELQSPVILQMLPKALEIQGPALIKLCIELGICKFNVNTELRTAYLAAAGTYLAQSQNPELVGMIQAVTEAVKDPVQAKIDLFGSVGKTS